MNKQTEALEMAKEMLLELNGHKIVTSDGHIVIDTSKQIKACKKALAQPACKHGVDDIEYYQREIQQMEREVIFYQNERKELKDKIKMLEQHQTSAETSAKEPDYWMQELPVMGASFSKTQSAYHTVPLYRHPPVTQEPVAWTDLEGNFTDNPKETFWYPFPLYTHPAPSWQGLSDDEIFELHHNWIMNSGNKDTQYDFARAIEQALKEKNGR